MHQPLFVQTSEGLINLCLVRYAMSLEIEGKRVMRFLFSADDASAVFVELPEDEGNRVIRTLMSERPDLFLAA